MNMVRRAKSQSNQIRSYSKIKQDLPEGIQDRKEVPLFLRICKRVIVSMPLTTLSHVDARTPHFTDNNIVSYESKSSSRFFDRTVLLSHQAARMAWKEQLQEECEISAVCYSSWINY